jgi:hypothetical protein
MRYRPNDFMLSDMLSGVHAVYSPLSQQRHGETKTVRLHGRLVPGKYTLESNRLITHRRVKQRTVRDTDIVPIDLNAVSFQVIAVFPGLYCE